METGGALTFTTYQPIFNTTTCTENGNSYLYVLNYATGGSFTSPQFDLNGDGFINTQDMVSVPNPNSPGNTMLVAVSGMSLGSVFAAAPTIRSGVLGASAGTGSADMLITESSGAIQNVIMAGQLKHRTAWWELRQ